MFNDYIKDWRIHCICLSVSTSVWLSVCLVSCILLTKQETCFIFAQMRAQGQSSRSLIRIKYHCWCRHLFTNWDKLCFFSFFLLVGVFWGTYLHTSNYHKIKLIYLISKVSWQFLRILIVFITTQSHIALVI